jgi:hypothetical protein
MLQQRLLASNTSISGEVQLATSTYFYTCTRLSQPPTSTPTDTTHEALALLQTHLDDLARSLLTDIICDCSAVVVAMHSIDNSCCCDQDAARQMQALVTYACNARVNSFALHRLGDTADQNKTLAHQTVAVTHQSIGHGLYARASFFNHSCAPNAIVCAFTSRTLCIKATTRIASNAEVHISYGPLAARIADATARREQLQRRYLFQCHCSACDAPLPSPSSSSSSLVLASTEQYRLAMTQVAKASHILSNLELLLVCDRDRAVHRAYELASSAAATLETTGSCNEQDIGLAHDTLARACVLQQSWPEAVLHCQRSVECVARSFGDASVEVGHEKIKLAQILLAMLHDTTDQRQQRYRCQARQALLQAKHCIEPSCTSSNDPTLCEIDQLLARIDRQ